MEIKEYANEDIENEIPELPVFNKVNRSLSIKSDNQKKIDASDFYRNYDNNDKDINRKSQKT